MNKREPLGHTRNLPATDQLFQARHLVMSSTKSPGNIMKKAHQPTNVSSTHHGQAAVEDVLSIIPQTNPRKLKLRKPRKNKPLMAM